MTVAPLHASHEEAAPRVQAHDPSLAFEHQRFARHLAAVSATPYQVEKYVDFHRTRALTPRSSFDAFLLALARSGVIGLVLADAYSGTLYRVCVLRAKLMLTLAILECSAPSFSALDAPDPGGRMTYLRMAWSVLKAALILACACLVLAPVHAWFALTSDSARSEV